MLRSIPFLSEKVDSITFSRKHQTKGDVHVKILMQNSFLRQLQYYLMAFRQISLIDRADSKCVLDVWFHSSMGHGLAQQCRTENALTYQARTHTQTRKISSLSIIIIAHSYSFRLFRCEIIRKGFNCPFGFTFAYTRYKSRHMITTCQTLVVSNMRKRKSRDKRRGTLPISRLQCGPYM